MNRLLAYHDEPEGACLGPFIEPLTRWERNRVEAFRAIAFRTGCYVIEDRTVPGVLCLTAKWLPVRSQP